MLTGTAIRIISAAHGRENPPQVRTLEKFINTEMPGGFSAQVSKTKCGRRKGKTITVRNASGEVVYHHTTCSPGADPLAIVKWIAGQLETVQKRETTMYIQSRKTGGK
jgi:hypothetical protein